MAIHDVKFTLPERPLGKEDIRFNIYRNKTKLGEIRISKGSLDYYPLNRRIPIILGWLEFDKLVRGSKTK